MEENFFCLVFDENGMVNGELLFMCGVIGVSLGIVDGIFEWVVFEEVLGGMGLW